MNRFLEGANIQAAFVPVDMATAANNGDWVNLKGYRRVLAVLFKAAGVAGDDPVFTLKQATDVAGSNAKALNFTRIYTKLGVQTAVGVFTQVDQAAAGTYTDATSAEQQAIFAVEILDEDLDVAGGFTCVQLSIPDVGAGGAQLGCGFYLMLEPKVKSSQPVSPIV